MTFIEFFSQRGFNLSTNTICFTVFSLSGFVVHLNQWSEPMCGYSSEFLFPLNSLTNQSPVIPVWACHDWSNRLSLCHFFLSIKLIIYFLYFIFIFNFSFFCFPHSQCNVTLESSLAVRPEIIFTVNQSHLAPSAPLPWTGVYAVITPLSFSPDLWPL